jgi:Ser/Thr protein kinase RdoA (MazF antagonist)
VIRAFADVDPALVPRVVASDPDSHRMLMEHVPGEDCWRAPVALIWETVGRFVAAQAAVTPPPGLPRRTPKDLAGHVAGLLDGSAGRELTAGELHKAWRLVETLPDLVAELDACGLPETVVHGDFHTGNWRSDGGPAVVLDFADAHVGHPVLDGVRPRLRMPRERWNACTAAWIDAWRTHAPGSDPALELAEPFQHLMYAVCYQGFLDGIETSERVYHEGDPASCIRAALG